MDEQSGPYNNPQETFRYLSLPFKAVSALALPHPLFSSLRSNTTTTRLALLLF